jgi:uncharacterized coiled-coil protein SlyX
MPRTSTSTTLHARIARLEARLASAPPEEINPFLHQSVVAEVEHGAAKLRAHLSRLAERWQSTPEDFVPWESRAVIEKLITAATPEQAAEASRLLQRLQDGDPLAPSAYTRRRQEQYFAAYEWQRRLQPRAEQRGTGGPVAPAERAP